MQAQKPWTARASRPFCHALRIELPAALAPHNNLHYACMHMCSAFVRCTGFAGYATHSYLKFIRGQGSRLLSTFMLVLSRSTEILQKSVSRKLYVGRHCLMQRHACLKRLHRSDQEQISAQVYKSEAACLSSDKKAWSSRL